MQTIQVGKFKAQFSSILEKVERNGEKFVIEYGRNHKKIAILSPFNESFPDAPKKRIFGHMKGKIIIPENFNDECQEIIEIFYGDKQ